ncbi:MAG: hypothetical protein C5S48_04770 [Candidatus Methanogaster sp.]|nr:MAG: hypothetical protein C5S48_04770 [ANME-2 cluster archaeon]
MTPDKTPSHIKLDERNHVENPRLPHLDMPGWGIIAPMQDLLTGKMRVMPLLSEPQEAGA